jgi:phage terminase large subunit-like protein
VESHVFLTQLAFLLAKCLEQKLRQAGQEGSISWALDHLSQLQAVEHTWEDDAVVAQATEIGADVQAILKAVGIQLRNPLLRVSQLPAA